MASKKMSADDKRTKPIRDARKASSFVKDWEKLSRSGKHDMHRLKEAMLLLIANDAPMPPEWKDHQLNGDLADTRECHVKGDLLLFYQIQKVNKGELVVFLNARTHSEVF